MMKSHESYGHSSLDHNVSIERTDSFKQQMKDELVDNDDDQVVVVYDDRSWIWKWVVLGLGAMQLFASYYAVDNPAATHDQMESHFGKESDGLEFEYFFGLTYTVYSVPNIVLPFLGGFLIDRYTPGIMNLVFCVILFLGQGVVTIGVWTVSPMTVLVGRTIFGIGAESLCVGVSSLLATWFIGSSVAFAMGISLSVSRLGSVINNVLSPTVSHSLSLTFSFGISCIFLGVAIVCALTVIRLDRSKRRLEEEKRALEPELVEQQTSERKSISFSAILTFPSIFWILCLSCVSVYGTVIPFNSISSAYLIERECGGSCCATSSDTSCPAHVDAEQKASLLMGIPYAISGVTVPFIGYAVDRWGWRASLTLFSAVCLGIVHFTLGLLMVPPAGLLILQGFAYSIYASALWPSVALVVRENETGMAYGLITALQNFGLAVIPLGVASLKHHYGNYHVTSFLFASLALVGVAAGIVLNVLDHFVYDDVLNRTTMTSEKELDRSYLKDESNLVVESAKKLLIESSPLLTKEDDLH